MRNVLADLAIESEAATATALRVARSYDEPDDGAFRRFATAVMKYWVTKRSAAHAAEALECLGGNGFVEDSGLPLLYRDAPLNSIWEGSGNVAALDVLRAIVKEPDGLQAFLAECELAAGGDAAAGRASRPHARAGRGRVRAAASPSSALTAVRRAALVEDLAVGAAGLAARPPRPGGGLRRVLRGPAGRPGRPRLRHAARRGRRGGDHRARAARR